MQSEREKMLAGQMYLAADPELVAARRRARRLCRIYNQSTEDDEAARVQVLSELFGQLGPKPEIEPPFYCDYGANIFAGERLYMNYGCVVLDCAAVSIGDRVLIAPGVHIYTATHPLDPAMRASGLEFALPVSIGNDAWIGGRAVICPGVTIGDEAVIGAGSVVNKDIPPGMLAVGNPCRVARAVRDTDRTA